MIDSNRKHTKKVTEKQRKGKYNLNSFEVQHNKKIKLDDDPVFVAFLTKLGASKVPFNGPAFDKELGLDPGTSTGYYIVSYQQGFWGTNGTTYAVCFPNM